MLASEFNFHLRHDLTQLADCLELFSEEDVKNLIWAQYWHVEGHDFVVDFLTKLEDFFNVDEIVDEVLKEAEEAGDIPLYLYNLIQKYKISKAF